MHKLTFGSVAVAVLALGGSAQAAFTISLSFTGLTASQQAVFTQAKTFWENNILDYKSGVDAKPSGLSITATGQAIDGAGGILGGANPTAVVTRNGTEYSTTGQMIFDSADLANLETSGALLPVIEHEMAHVIGFGTLWVDNGLYITGSGKYTGTAALTTYKVEFSQPLATWVPVELAGGSGTANGHWDENTGGGTATGIKDLLNRDKQFELMTGWLDTPTFLSNTTLQQFFDLGYIVAASPVSVPEPMSVAFVGIVGFGALLRRRRAN
jgi:hypothetical protein